MARNRNTTQSSTPATWVSRTGRSHTRQSVVSRDLTTTDVQSLQARRHGYPRGSSLDRAYQQFYRQYNQISRPQQSTLFADAAVQRQSQGGQTQQHVREDYNNNSNHYGGGSAQRKVSALRRFSDGESNIPFGMVITGQSEFVVHPILLWRFI